MGWGAMLPRLEVMWAQLGAVLAQLGAMLVHLRSYVAPAAFGFGVRGVGVGRSWFVLEGLGLVG